MKKRTALKNMLKSLKPRHSMSMEERYLSEATDLVDLEIRQKNLRNGQAPHQRITRIW